MIKDWDTFHARKNQENWKCSVWRRLRGILLTGCKYLMAGNEEESSRLFSVVPTVRTRGSRPRLEHSKFNLDTRKHLPTVRVAQHWHGLPRQVVKSPPCWTWSGATCCNTSLSAGVLDKAACVLQRCVQPKHFCELIHYFCDPVKGLIDHFIYMGIITMFSCTCVYVWNQLVSTGDTSSIPV